jgi:uncharacterized protein
LTFNSRTIDPADRAPEDRRRRRRCSGGAAAALAVLLWAAPSGAKTWPEPRGTLSDFAGVVDPASADSIEALGAELRAKTGAQLAVVTEGDLGGEPIENEAVGIFQQWGIGRKQKDDGVLVLLAVSERRVRIEVGYGLEGILPDGRCGFIIRRVMGPDLAADRFGPGLWRGADAIAGVIARDRGVTLAPGRGAPLPEETDSRTHSLLPLLVLFVIFTVFSWITRGVTGRGGRTRSRRGWMGPFWGGFGGFGGYGGGFGGSGGLGGGFGGFGGGRSGGGGASGGF